MCGVFPQVIPCGQADRWLDRQTWQSEQTHFFMQIQTSFGISDVCLLGSVTGDCVYGVVLHMSLWLSLPTPTPKTF
jgi:hypothetical protein